MNTLNPPVDVKRRQSNVGDVEDKDQKRQLRCYSGPLVMSSRVYS